MPLVGTRIETSSENFGQMVRDNCLLVDKTLLIKEFWENQKTSLIIRPRRFGKSLNLSMLQHFFAPEVYGYSTKGLFDAFQIAKVDDGKFIQEHQGQYSVIFITFKDIKENTYGAAVNKIRLLIQGLYREHEQLLQSDKLSPADKAEFEKCLTGVETKENIEESVKLLSELLHKAYGKAVMIFIDEYDTPLTSAYEHKFLEECSEFLRNMLSAALKGNPYLKKGLMTGILRVSKNSMLSGLNNLGTYTLFDRDYQQYFGFTEAEIDELVKTFGVNHDREDIRNFYNGYKMGDEVVYNPWSIMNFLKKKELAPFWVWTSNDKLFKELLLSSSEETKEKLIKLLQNHAIKAEIDPNLRYEDLMENPESLWALLLFCGYLKVEESHLSDINMNRICQIKIPNREVMRLFNGVFIEWMKHTIGYKYNAFLNNLTNGNVEAFTEDLSEFLMNSLSFRDVGGDKKPTERFYHGFFIGLTASLKEKYHYTSNRESGLGVYDVGLIPNSPQNNTGVILEFKHVKREQNLQQEANNALAQIETMQNETEFKKHPHVKKLLKIGLAFSDKAVISAYKTTDLFASQSQQNSVVVTPVYHEKVNE